MTKLQSDEFAREFSGSDPAKVEHALRALWCDRESSFPPQPLEVRRWLAENHPPVRALPERRNEFNEAVGKLGRDVVAEWQKRDAATKRERAR